MQRRVSLLDPNVLRKKPLMLREKDSKATSLRRYVLCCPENSEDSLRFEEKKTEVSEMQGCTPGTHLPNSGIPPYRLKIPLLTNTENAQSRKLVRGLYIQFFLLGNVIKWNGGFCDSEAFFTTRELNPLNARQNLPEKKYLFLLYVFQQIIPRG